MAHSPEPTTLLLPGVLALSSEAVFGRPLFFAAAFVFRQNEPLKLELHQNSLFAVLMRSPWWISAALAVCVFAATKLFLPAEFAVFAAAPFIVIALYVAWKALRTPSAGRIARTLERITALSREEFTAALEAGWREQGYEVSRAKGTQADLELRRAGRLALVGCRRWKAASSGLMPIG